MKEKSAFTLLELMIVIAILALLGGVVAVSFSSLDGEQSLDKATLTILSVLNDAKSNADSSKNASSSGVRIGSNAITEFIGSYGNQDSVYSLSGLVQVSTSTGIGTDIIFQNVTGITSASGTITVSLKNNPSQNEVIQVYATGVIQKD